MMLRPLLVLLLLCSLSGQAQQSARRISWLGWPIVGYTPETNWGFGAGTSLAGRLLPSDTLSPPSRIGLTAAITLNDQKYIALPYEFYWKQRKHMISGEISYSDYFFSFFGIGNLPSDEAFEERYAYDQVLARIHYLRKIRPRLFVGARWWFESMELGGLDAEGRLVTGQIPGFEGGILNSPGLVLLYDSRDRVYTPSSGQFAELSVHTASSMTGSDYAYERFRLDLRSFYAMGEKSVLAMQFFTEHLTGSPPFFALARLGGASRLRGYFEGRYRDLTDVLVQTEYRYTVYRNWGVVAFAGAGWVAEDYRSLSNRFTRTAGGIGLRYNFAREKRINIRLDYAVGKNSSGIYLTVGEAF